jgi:hypothetical protein
MSKDFRLPGDTHRIAILGRTGSGKTVAALWHLSKRDLRSRAWVIVDFKTDENINNIQRARHIELGVVPSKPGVYIVHPRPNQITELTAYLWQLWEKGNIGIYVDEGYMMGNNEAFEAILTQGRSLHLPMIVLSQRPAWISRFVFSEADFFQVFHLNDKRDRKTVESFIPQSLDVRLPDYHSYYYDVGRDSLRTLAPVPSEGKILASIDEQLRPNRTII